MSARIFVGPEEVEALPVDDRGLAYGDGLFETMRVHRGSVPWWDAHWARLAHGAQRLRMTLPERAFVERQAIGMCADADAGVLKLIVTRGSGGRGYAPTLDNVPTWVLSRHALPASPPAEGLRLHRCETRLALQPALAGLKHCNRLEQVLARAECTDAGADEGLMCSIDGDVVGATAANLFVLRDGGWVTPLLDRCGIKGLCRDWWLAEVGAGQARLSVAEVETAAAVVLCNAVRGILPVARLGDRAWPPHPAVVALRRKLSQAHPAFPEPVEDA